MQRDEITPSNSLKDKLDRQEVGLCMAIRLFTQPDMVLIAKGAGLDAIYIDLEHGSISPDAVRQVAVTAIAANIACLVRVPSLDDISRVLDAGASGVICPGIETAEEVHAAIAAAKFPPQGNRGVAATFPHFGYRPIPASQSLPAMNASSMIIAQIESAKGLANLDAIASVRGLDMLFVGANDLLADLGLAGDFDHPKLNDAFLRVIAACKQHNLTCGIGGLTSRPQMIAKLVSLGANFISIGNDISLLTNSIRSGVEKFSNLEKSSPIASNQ